MKEQDIKDLGFRRVDVSPEEAGDDIGFYYYIYDIIQHMSLITSSNDEAVKEGEWIVEIFDVGEGLEFKQKEDVRAFIDLIEKNKKIRNNGK
tara:strand:- start:715 stop:990 length:276 start_codon:yes stop_codon:yes gene_type:complete